MDGRWTVRGLITHGNAFARALRAVEDSNVIKKRQCDQLAAEVDATTQMWDSLWQTLQDPSLSRGQIFTNCYERIFHDNVNIISSMSHDLATIVEKHNKVRQKFRLVPGHNANHPLVRFLGNGATLLRQKQIRYTHAVLKLIFTAVVHAKALGHRHSTPQQLQDALEEQQAVIGAHFEYVLDETEERVPGNSVFSHKWLDGCDFHSQANGLPLDKTALLWFRPGLVKDSQRRDRPTSNKPRHDANSDEESEEDSSDDEDHDSIKQEQLRHDLEVEKQLRRTEMQNFRSAFDETRREVYRLSSQVGNQAVQIENQALQSAADQREIDGLKTQTKNMEANLQLQRVRAQKLEKEVETLRRDNQGLKSTVAALKKENKELHQLVKEYKQVKQEYRNLSVKYKELADTNSKQSAEIAEMKKQLLNVANEKRALEERRATACRVAHQWKDLAESRKVGDEERSNLQTEVAKLEEHIVSLNGKLAAKEDKTTEDRLRTQRNAAQAQGKKLQTDLDTERSQYKKLQTRWETVQSEMAKLQRELDTSRSHAKQLQGRLSNHQSTGPNAYNNNKDTQKKGHGRGRSRSASRGRSRAEQAEPPPADTSRGLSRDSGTTCVEESPRGRDFDKGSIRSGGARSISISSAFSHSQSAASSPVTNASSYVDDDDDSSEVADFVERVHRRTSSSGSGSGAAQSKWESWFPGLSAHTAQQSSWQRSR